MICEVWRDGKRMFWTESEKCVPSEAVQKAMKKAGCKIKTKNAPGRVAARSEASAKEVISRDKQSIPRGARKSKGA